MPSIDLLFPVIGSRLPTDHTYPLYAAISHLLPGIHDANAPFSMSPITGQYSGNGTLVIVPRESHLRVRVSLDRIPSVVTLAGKQLRVMGQRLIIGVPQVYPLTPSPSLIAHAVTIKHATEEESFLVAVRRQLDDRGIAGRVEIPRIVIGARQGEPRRHVMRIKDSTVICYSLLVHDLNPDESLRLLEIGLGGRRRMGGGLFLAALGEIHQ